MTGPDEPTTRADFPGGFPGDTRNAFSPDGRSKEQRELFDYIRRLMRLRKELDPLRHGNLVNLYVSSQQYAYARTTERDSVLVVFNNDSRTAQVEFDLDQVRLPRGATLSDRLGLSKELKVSDGRLHVSLPARSVAILVGR
jgi:neopullulanase